jgi:hypothetical protein
MDLRQRKCLLRSRELESYLIPHFAIERQHASMANSYLVIQQWLLRELTHPLTTRWKLPWVARAGAWMDRGMIEQIEPLPDTWIFNCRFAALTLAMIRTSVLVAGLARYGLAQHEAGKNLAARIAYCWKARLRSVDWLPPINHRPSQKRGRFPEPNSDFNKIAGWRNSRFLKNELMLP